SRERVPQDIHSRGREGADAGCRAVRDRVLGRAQRARFLGGQRSLLRAGRRRGRDESVQADHPEMRVLTATLLCLAAALPAAAQQFTSGARGTASAQFLKLGVGARGESLGGAYAAEADGADALYWNPAALTRVYDGAATVMHAPYIASSFYDYA